MVKNRHILLVGIFVLAGFFLTFLVGYHFHYVAQRRYEAYQGVVKEALVEALLSEIDKRDTIPIPYHGDIGGNHSKKQSEDCYALQAKTEVGALEMTVSETKLKENITDNATISGLHSLLLSLNPMNADTLYKEIQRIMPASMVKRGRQWIRLNYTDNNKVRTTTYAPDSVGWQHADSLYSRNVGYLCELEATVFTFPVWFQLLTMKEWGLCIAMLLLWLMVYVWRKPLFRRVDQLFVHEEIITKEVEKPVIKAIPINTVDMDIDTSIYRLREGIYFDEEKRELFTPTDRIKLVPRSAEILQLILENPKHICSKQELKNRFWPDEAPSNLSNRLSNAIYKLNKELKMFVPLSIVSEGDHYRLVWEDKL